MTDPTDAAERAAAALNAAPDAETFAEVAREVVAGLPTCSDLIAGAEAAAAALSESGYAVGGLVEGPRVPLESDAALCTYRLPSEYMRQGMSPWTTDERAYVEQVNDEAARGLR